MKRGMDNESLNSMLLPYHDGSAVEEANASTDLCLQESHEKEYTVDQAIQAVGEFGLYQFRILTLALIISFPSTFQILIMYFIGYSPPWQCVQSTNNTECNYTGTITIARKEIYVSRCKMNQQSWEYTVDKAYSFTTELDLICDLTVYASFASASFYIGWGLGCVPLGATADKFGRKPVMFASLVMMLAFVFLQAFIKAYWQFVLLRLLTGFFSTGVGLSAYIIVVELVGPKKRAAVATTMLVLGGVAIFILTLKAYLLQNWRVLCIVCSAPYFILLCFWCLIPESIRWLVSQGKAMTAKRILCQMAYHNGKHMPKCRIIQSTSVVKSQSFLECFRRRKLLLRTALLGFAWFVAALTFYGVSLAASDLSGNLYTDFLLLLVAEIPAAFLFVYLVNRSGRKYGTCASFFLAGVFCLLLSFFPEESDKKALVNLRISFGMLAKFFNGMAFNGCYVWSTELFPTVVRTQSVSFSSFIARFGATSAPFVIGSLRLVYPSLPFIVIGGFSLLAGISNLLLPESKGVPTVETFEDAEEFFDGKRPVKKMIDLRLLSQDSNGALLEDEVVEDEVVEWSRSPEEVKLLS